MVYWCTYVSTFISCPACCTLFHPFTEFIIVTFVSKDICTSGFANDRRNPAPEMFNESYILMQNLFDKAAINRTIALTN